MTVVGIQVYSALRFVAVKWPTMSSARSTETTRVLVHSVRTPFPEGEAQAFVILAAQLGDQFGALLSVGDTQHQLPLASLDVNAAQVTALGEICLRVAQGSASGLILDLSAQTQTIAASGGAREAVPGFYAGVPLYDGNGAVIATLGVLAHEPPPWSPRHQHLLQRLGERLAARAEHDDTSIPDLSEAGLASASNRLLAELSTIAAASQDAIIGLDPQAIVTSWNPAAEVIYGHAASEMVGHSICRIVPAERQEEECRIIEAALRGEAIAPYETVRVRKDGREVHVQISCAPIRDARGRIVRIAKFARDITPLLEREREAVRHSRLYAALTRIAQIVVREPPREKLLQEACGSLVEEGVFCLAWIGWFEPETQRLVPVASSGSPLDYVHDLHVFADVRPEGCGPTGTAFRTGQYVVSNDLANDPSVAPWRVAMVAAGMHSSAALPIREGGRVVGTLSVYSRQKGFFHAPEASLLERFVNGIGFGLDNLARNEVIREAQLQVDRERRLTRAIIESAPGVLYMCDESGHMVRWSHSLERFSGFEPEQLRQFVALDLVVPQDRERARATIEAVFTQGKASVEARMRGRDGNERPYLLSGRRVELDGRAYLVGMGIDIGARIAAERARELSERRYRGLFEHAPAGVMVIDAAGICIDVNPRACAILHKTSDTLRGRSLSELMGTDNVASIADVFADIDAHGRYQREWHVSTQDGEVLVILAAASRMPDDTCLLGLRDITERKMQESRIARLSRLRRMIGAIQSAMLRRGERADLLQAACRIAVEDGDFVRAWVVELETTIGAYRLSAVSACGDGKVTALGHVFDPEENANRIGVRALRSARVVVINQLAPDDLFPIEQPCAVPPARLASAAALPLFVAGKVDCVLVLMAEEADFFDAEEVELLEWVTRDLSYALEHIDTTNRLHHLTYSDALTGLMNQAAFHERLVALDGEARSRQMRLCVCVFDLEHFRDINQQFGRAQGDLLLTAIGQRLRLTFGAGTDLARVGGDTFGVAELSAVDDACESLRTRVHACFATPFALAGHEITLVARIGSASYPDPVEPHASVLDLAHARTALGLAKAENLRSLHFSRERHRSLGQVVSLEVQLREALEREQFVLHYQPKLDLVSGEIVAAEALIRWQHPERGLVMPGEFIGQAEQRRLIVPLGTWVLDKVCAQQAAWRAEGIPMVPVAANISAAQVDRGDLLQVVRAALERHALEAQWLELELTESAVMQDMARSISTLDQLRALGVSLALDDFGTGYSSLSHLKQLPFHRVKIDRGFVRDVTRSMEDSAIALAIIGIARSLHLKVVAEGVETEAQMRFLAAHQCDEMQGFFFSPPVPADVFARYLAERRRISIPDARQAEQSSLLLVDDESGICNALTRLLRRDGYRIITANNGEQALDLLALQPVQVIVSDQRMPGMSGTELLDRVKNLYPDTVRMILSGYTDLKAVTDSVNRGAVFRFLTKPWDDDDLRKQIREAFAHYRAQRGAAAPHNDAGARSA